MQLEEREKNILAVLCVIVLLALFFFVYRPSGVKNKELKTQIKSLKAELAKPMITKDSVAELQDAVAAIKNEIITLNEQLPLTEKRGFLIRDLEDLAKENQIEISSFIPKEAVPITMTGKEIDKRSTRYKRRSQKLEEHHAKVLKTIISIDAKGKFSDIMNFFQDIITYYRAVEVSDLILTRASAGGSRKTSSADKRFGGGRRKEDPVQAAKNMNLNISFTLLAYTSIVEESHG